MSPSRATSRLRHRLVLAALALVAPFVAFAILCWLYPVARIPVIRSALWVGARARPAGLVALQRTLDPSFPPRSVLLCGDSLIAMLPPSSVDARAINLGLGAATTEHLRAQLRELHSPATARALVLLVGTNDVVHRPLAAAESDLRSLLAALPAALPVLLCTIPPVDPVVQHDRPPATIVQLNARWTACAAARPGTRLVRSESVLADPAGHLLSSLHQGDGLHLNPEGNRRLAALLRTALAEVAP